MTAGCEGKQIMCIKAIYTGVNSIAYSFYYFLNNTILSVLQLTMKDQQQHTFSASNNVLCEVWVKVRIYQTF